MTVWWIAAAVVVVVVWMVAEAKTSRPDGTLCRVHPYRRVLAFILPTRDGSTVYFDSYVDAEALLAYLDEAGPAFGANVTHATVAAVATGLAENPRMNRFTSGYRLYQRRGRWITFSMKRKRMNKEAKVSAVKLEMRDDDTFRTLCERMGGHIEVERSDKKTYADKEFQLFELLPRPVFWIAVRALRLVNYFNLLPAGFIESDAMHTSVFVANLGSLGMGAGYHHNYEWGTCPLFMMVGQIEDRVVPWNGEPAVRPTLHLRYTYDERIDDGLTARFGIETVKRVLEDPRTFLGCLAEDGADARRLAEPTVR
ncbi:MAG: hypothetical protein ACI8PZ_004963 [Myxococcota bacterium]|jgi:hypothetical protein